MLANERPTRTDTGTSGVATSNMLLPEIGASVGERYRITRLIGAGGMGTVFEAEMLNLGRRCAIKFLRVERASRSHSTWRFEREARLLGRLDHDHLAAVLDYGTFQERTPYYVMEYLEGETLRQVLHREGALAAPVALELMQQICRGMGRAHENAVVHRDLKPDNLMLTHRSDGQCWIKILDFGVARWTEDGEVPPTPTGAELGTAHYMSPEQARGAKDIDARSDVYALGAVFYEMLSGRRLHSGGSYNEVLFQLLTQAHEPLSAAAVGCPSAIVDIVERCLHKNRAERFDDGNHLLGALLELGAVRPVFSMLPLEARAPAAAVKFGARERPRGRRAALWLVSGATLGASLTLGVLALHASSTDASRQQTIESLRPAPAAPDPSKSRPTPAALDPSSPPRPAPALDPSSASTPPKAPSPARVSAPPERAKAPRPAAAAPAEAQARIRSGEAKGGQATAAGERAASLAADVGREVPAADVGRAPGAPTAEAVPTPRAAPATPGQQAARGARGLERTPAPPFPFETSNPYGAN